MDLEEAIGRARLVLLVHPIQALTMFFCNVPLVRPALVQVGIATNWYSLHQELPLCMASITL